MAYCIKLKVSASTNRNLKYYIYRSKSAIDIDTIAKIKNILPVMVIDEATYDSAQMDGTDYVAYDNQVKSQAMVGIDYVGPEPVAIPANEYEALIENNTFNEYTYSIILKLNPLPITYNGIMYYYSVIGVDTSNDTITHLSRVKAELLLSDYVTAGTREILYCDNYTGFPTDEWNPLATPDWDTDIVLGDVKNPLTYNRYGSPFVDAVPIFNNAEVDVDTRCALLFNHITMKVPNIWRTNNTKYNYRKLKSFKLRNIYDNKYGDFSEPTYQSQLPVTNERMLIFKKDVTTVAVGSQGIPIDMSETELLSMAIIRKNGLYYDNQLHRQLGSNRFNIQEQEKIAVFSEASVQEKISIDFEVSGGATYNYTFYIQDVYGKYSEPTVLIVET